MCLLTCKLDILVRAGDTNQGSCTAGQGMKGKTATISQPKNEEHIGLGKKALMYADLGNLSLVITPQGFGLSSKPVIISGRDKNSPDLSPESGELTEMELEVDFGDNAHYGMLKVHQDDDGVLEVSHSR